MEDIVFPVPESEPPPRPPEARGAPRIVGPNRGQVELRAVDLESLVAEDHPVRAVWEFVESLDLSALYAKVQSVEARAGRPATDPRIYLALWLYATIEGVGSARALARLGIVLGGRSASVSETEVCARLTHRAETPVT